MAAWLYLLIRYCNSASMHACGATAGQYPPLRMLATVWRVIILVLVIATAGGLVLVGHDPAVAVVIVAFMGLAAAEIAIRLLGPGDATAIA